ncbi:hypothetical protein OG523_05690 [Streptomyces virginiae]|uniref:hypothetical protein n=1 Tax=Streptomyces virginiae TaxID=1961 RepID=UPI002E300F18|nr:hypothetical protein [Streptomyces virginiae]
MSAEHARPSRLFHFARGIEGCPAHAARRRHPFTRRLRGRILAYRDIEFVASETRCDRGADEGFLLLVHVGKVVGEIRYRRCAACARGVITGVDIDPVFRSTGLDTRALSHLRARHPGIAWRSTLTLRTTRGLLRRMRIPTSDAGADVGATCPHDPARRARP